MITCYFVYYYSLSCGLTLIFSPVNMGCFIFSGEFEDDLVWGPTQETFY
jgi:hypothetical protein